jgi:hypothetical protein
MSRICEKAATMQSGRRSAAARASASLDAHGRGGWLAASVCRFGSRGGRDRVGEGKRWPRGAMIDPAEGGAWPWPGNGAASGVAESSLASGRRRAARRADRRSMVGQIRMPSRWHRPVGPRRTASARSRRRARRETIGPTGGPTKKAGDPWRSPACSDPCGSVDGGGGRNARIPFPKH